MLAKLSQIVANKFRDQGKHPLRRDKIDGIKESTKDTGAWRNLVGRPLNNEITGIAAEELPGYLAGLSAAYDESGEPLFTIELSYGHHRLAAWTEMGIDEIDIDVKSVDDKTQLQIMANENKGDWSSNTTVLLETVRQTKAFLEDSIAPYDAYEDYANTQGDGAFFNKDQFAKAKEQGIGFKTIRNFLGETWAEMDIRSSVATLKAIALGLYEQEQIVNFPSVGVLGAFTKVAEGTFKQPWPPYFQRKMVDDIATMIADPKISTTVKILKSAQQAVNDGKDPVRVVKNPGVKRQDFNVVHAIKDLVYENGMDPEALTLADIPEMEGFKGFEGLDAILEDVQKSINRSEAGKAGAVPVEGADEGTAGEDGQADADQAEVDQVVADAEASAAAGAADMPPLPEVEDGEDTPVQAVADMFCARVPVVQETIAMFGSRIGEIDDSKAPCWAAAEELFRDSARLFLAIYGPDELNSVIGQLLK